MVKMLWSNQGFKRMFTLNTMIEDVTGHITPVKIVIKHSMQM